MKQEHSPAAPTCWDAEITLYIAACQKSVRVAQALRRSARTWAIPLKQLREEDLRTYGERARADYTVVVHYELCCLREFFRWAVEQHHTRRSLVQRGITVEQVAMHLKGTTVVHSPLLSATAQQVRNKRLLAAAATPRDHLILYLICVHHVPYQRVMDLPMAQVQVTTQQYCLQFPERTIRLPRESGGGRMVMRYLATFAWQEQPDDDPFFVTGHASSNGYRLTRTAIERIVRETIAAANRGIASDNQLRPETEQQPVVGKITEGLLQREYHQPFTNARKRRSPVP